MAVNPEDFGAVKVGAGSSVKPEDFGATPVTKDPKFIPNNVAPPVKDDAPSMGPLVGGMEAIGSAGTGLLGSVVGAGAGVVHSLAGAKPGEADQTAAKVSRAMTYEPRSKEGRSIMDTLGTVTNTLKIPPVVPEAAALSAAQRPSVSVSTKAKPAPSPKPTPGAGAERVLSHMQDIREKIEGRVSDKTAKAESVATDIEDRAQSRANAHIKSAEQGLANAQGRGKELSSTTAGNMGITAREAAEVRKGELEGLRDAEKEKLFEALESGTKVNVTGIPKQIDLMLQNEKNPDIVAALVKAKRTLLSKEEAKKLDKIDLKTPEGRAQLQEALSEADGKRERWDSSMKGLDSARLAMKAMMSGRGGDPADMFAKAQLTKVVGMLEDAMTSASPQYGEFLEKWSEKSRALDPFSAATGAGKRTAGMLKKDPFGSDFMTSPESVGPRFFKGGDEGAAAAREFKTAVGDSEAALKSMQDYLQGKVKEMPAGEWGSFLKRHEPALREFGLYDKLKDIHDRATQAAERLAATKESTKKAMSEAMDQAKEVREGAKRTSGNVATSLKSTAIGKLTDMNDLPRLRGGDAQQKIETVFKGSEPRRDLKQLVSATKNNPEAAKGLRSAYTEWLTEPDVKTGQPKANSLIQKWADTREAVKSSGLMTPEHIASMDKIMEDIRKSAQGGSIRKAWSSTAGFIMGSTVGHPIVGAHALRDITTSAVSSKNMKALESAVMQIAGTPEGARALAAPPTPANIERIRVMLPTDIAATIAPVESGDQQRRRNNPLSMQPAGL